MNYNDLTHEKSGHAVTDIEGGFAEVITLLVMEFGSCQKLDQFLEKVSTKFPWKIYRKILKSVHLLHC